MGAEYRLAARTFGLFNPKRRHGGLSIADRIDASGDCWEWAGARFRSGYGQVKYEGRTRLVHRLVWEALVGTVPDGMQLDHLCRNRICCNPDHLRVVTQKENNDSSPAYRATRKKKNWSSTHCKNGHEWTDENTYINSHGWRICRTCQQEAYRRRKAGL